MPLGVLCVGYRNSAALGSGYATPTFNELASVQDLTITIAGDSFDASTRLEKGVRVYEVTMHDISVSFKHRVPDLGATMGDPTFDDLQAILGAWRTRAVLDCMFLDGSSSTNGAEGIRGFFKVHKMDQDQSNNVSTFWDVELKPAPVDGTTLASTASAQAMRHVKVATGAPTYANWGSNSFS